MNLHLRGLLLLCAVSISPASLADWRPITPAEEQFVQLVESEVHAQLRAAAQRMGSKWQVDILDKYQRDGLDEGQHNGRPHEVRISLYMHYEPADDIELGRMDQELDEFNQKVDRMEPVPAEVVRNNPAFKRKLYAQLIVNLGWFEPLGIQKAVSTGYEIHEPEAVFAFVDWKNAGDGAPKGYLYFGEYKRTSIKGEGRMVETFASKPSKTLNLQNPDRDCRNVRTILLITESNEEVIAKFIKSLDLKALNALIARH